MIGEEVYRTDDGGKTWKKVSPDKQKVGGGPGYYYMQIRIDPNDANHVYVLTVGVHDSKDGGKTWSSPFRFGGDNHALWIDPANSKPHDPRLRPRHGDHLRRRQELVPPRRAAARAVLRRGLRHHVAVQRRRRPAGQRLAARPEHQAGRPAASCSRTGRRSAAATACTTSSTPSPTAISTTSRSSARSRAWTSTRARPRASRTATSRSASTGTRRSSCRRTTRRSSTTRRTSC